MVPFHDIGIALFAARGCGERVRDVDGEHASIEGFELLRFVFGRSVVVLSQVEVLFRVVDAFALSADSG